LRVIKVLFFGSWLSFQKLHVSPLWLEHLQFAFSKNSKTVVGNFFGKMFQNWSVNSKKVRAGPEAFKPFLHYLTYNHAFTSMSVIRNKQKLKPKPVDRSVMDAELEAKHPKKQILPDYDLGDGDEDVAALAAAKDDGIDEEELEDEDIAAAAKDEDTTEELEDEMPRWRMARRGMPVPRREKLLARRRVPPPRRAGHQGWKDQKCFFSLSPLCV
jgi:hypothetical protein